MRHTHPPSPSRNTLACSITTITAALAFAPWAFAADSSTQLEEIQVTGSRIRLTDGMATPTPVTSITPAELQLYEPGATITEQLD
ncbi:MAG: hypothetical protein LBF16_02820, partial [Pseudomonadales bacterium]|nr:hypothetical protein [Pseudomonadales bacterium]